MGLHEIVAEYEDETSNRIRNLQDTRDLKVIKERIEEARRKEGILDNVCKYYETDGREGANFYQMASQLVENRPGFLKRVAWGRNREYQREVERLEEQLFDVENTTPAHRRAISGMRISYFDAVLNYAISLGIAGGIILIGHGPEKNLGAFIATGIAAIPIVKTAIASIEAFQSKKFSQQFLEVVKFYDSAIERMYAPPKTINTAPVQ